MGVFLDGRMGARKTADGAVQVDERGMPVRLSIVENTLDPGVFSGAVIVAVYDNSRGDGRFPVTKGKLDGLSGVLELGSKDRGFPSLPSIKCYLNRIFQGEEVRQAMDYWPEVSGESQ